MRHKMTLMGGSMALSERSSSAILMGAVLVPITAVLMSITLMALGVDCGDEAFMSFVTWSFSMLTSYAFSFSYVWFRCRCIENGWI